MRGLPALISAILVLCAANGPAFAEKRVAFVVGNSNYQNVVPLANPDNDAAAMAEMFRKASFDVVEFRSDLTNTELRRALRDFTEKVRDADIAVIYYAGHGLEVDGANYLIPVDAVLERDTDAYDEAISLDRILRAVEPARQLRLVILDACRDNPFTKKMKRTVASRSLGRGLAGVEPDRPNTLIAFAAKGGSTASDGDGKNSPFASALLKYLGQPGLELGKAFRLVRDDVMNTTGNQQEPFVYGSLGGKDVSLVPAPAAPPASAGGNDNRKDYELAERVGTREAWDSFIAAHPSGFYTDLAKAQRNKLAAEAERNAAAEKARAAADEQARLAAAGAKAAEQARAAEKAKAAEQARLAAEQKKQEEDAKLAAAKQAEQEHVAAENAAKAEAAVKQAAAAAKPEQGHEAPARPAVAAVVPEEEPERPPPQDLPRLLQVELKRVGCKTGDVEGEWNAAARRALALFNEKTGTKFDAKVASLDALDAVRAKPGRVCPLECERGYRADGDRCVKITCDEGYVVGPGGRCQKRPERAPKVTRGERRGPASSGRRCFVYGGTSFCE